MTSYRFSQTIARFFRKKRAWLMWEQVPDPRKPRGRRWSLPQMLQTLVAGLVVLKRSLRALDAALTKKDIALARLGAGRRIPDATLQAVLPRISPDGVRAVLIQWNRQALRSKVLADPPRRPGMPRPLCFAALDGKNVYTGKTASNEYSQRLQPRHGPARYLNRVLRVLWIGPGPRLVLDQRPIAADSNDMGTLIPLLVQMEESYGALTFLEGVSVDAGMTSKENADAIDGRGLAYMMGLKGNQPELYAEAQRVLRPLTQRTPPEAETRERYQGQGITRQFWRTAELAAWPGWPHLRQVWLVRQITEKAEGGREIEDRFFLTNLLWKRASAKHFLALVRQHWWIENPCFWRLDVDFDEEHPWSMTGWGPFVMGVLLGLAFNILHLLRNRTLRGERPPQESFAAVVELMTHALVYGAGYEAGRRAAGV